MQLSIVDTASGGLAQSVPKVPRFDPNPQLKYHMENLPIYDHKESILDTIRSNQVTIVSGETGSGKTTQVPQYLLSQSRSLGQPVKIVCTEPRRIAAISVSERVALETATKFGDLIGYQVRLESCTSPYTLLTFCTNGVLLRYL